MTPPKWVPRTEWGAPPTTPASDMASAAGVKVHWIGGTYTTPDHAQCAAEVRAIRQEHLSNPTEGWVDIAYNLLICGHGYVFEGRGVGKESGANGDQGLNREDYAVCAIVGTNESDSPDLLQGIRDAIAYLRQNGAGNEVLGHRDGYNTDCPGDALYHLVHTGQLDPGAVTPTPAPAPAPAPPPTAPAPAWPGVYLQQGSTGAAVERLQSRLHDRGWTITADGQFGPKTESVVRAFQQDSTAHGWPLTVDGIVGPATWSALWNRPIS